MKCMQATPESAEVTSIVWKGCGKGGKAAEFVDSWDDGWWEAGRSPLPPHYSGSEPPESADWVTLQKEIWRDWTEGGQIPQVRKQLEN